MPSLTEPAVSDSGPGLLKTLYKRPLFVLGLLGAASGALAALTPEPIAESLRPLGDLVFLKGIVIHPALLFAPVIAYGVWAFGGAVGRARWRASGLAAFATIAGWSAAVRIAVHLHELNIGASWLPSDGLLPGFVAGAAGAALVFLGGAITVPVLRGLRIWTVGVAIGAVAGLLLPVALSSDYDRLGALCLFAVWQACVAGWFGLGLERNKA